MGFGVTYHWAAKGGKSTDQIARGAVAFESTLSRKPWLCLDQHGSGQQSGEMDNHTPAYQMGVVQRMNRWSHSTQSSAAQSVGLDPSQWTAPLDAD